jgi:hypothetical protein
MSLVFEKSLVLTHLQQFQTENPPERARVQASPIFISGLSDKRVEDVVSGLMRFFLLGQYR